MRNFGLALSISSQPNLRLFVLSLAIFVTTLSEVKPFIDDKINMNYAFYYSLIARLFVYSHSCAFSALLFAMKLSDAFQV